MIGDEEATFVLLVGAGVKQATFDQNLENIFVLADNFSPGAHLPLWTELSTESGQTFLASTVLPLTFSAT